MADEMKRLISKRAGLKSQLTLFTKFLGNYNVNDDSAIPMLQNRLGKIEVIFDSFNVIQDDIELISNPDDFDTNLNEREQFQNTYFQALTTAKNIIDKTKSIILNDDENTSSEKSNTSQFQRTNVNIRLPKIDLPTFDGTFTAWQQYHDSFMVMIDTNNELSEVQKFCYLKASLKGEPASMLTSLKTTNSNYPIAWRSLCGRYNQKRRIIDTHVRNILNLETISTFQLNSHTKLRHFINEIENNIKCLEALGQSVSTWDAILIPIILNKLNDNLTHEWELKLSNYAPDYLPNYNEIIQFLNTKQATLETIIERKADRSQENKNVQCENKFKRDITKSFSTTETNCLNCDGNHYIQNCQRYLNLSVDDRNKTIKRLKLCLNCLKPGHFIQECKSSECRICKKKHHTTLHINYSLEKQNNQTKANCSLENEDDGNNSSIVSCNAMSNTQCQVLLSTVEVYTYDSNGKRHILRILLDNASQSNFITKQACSIFNLKTEATKMSVAGISQLSTNINEKTELVIHSKVNNFKTKIGCYVIDKITGNLPTVNLNIQALNIPPNIKLADPKFNYNGKIDMLIGASIFYQLLCIGQIRDKGLVYQKTIFGWIVSGTIFSSKNSNTTTLLSISNIHEQLQNFWKIDEFTSSKNVFTPDEMICEKIFKNTTTRNIDGKFIVNLPLKSNINLLGNNYENALKRLKRLENRFQKDDHLKKQYVDCINDYKGQGHMSKVPLQIEDCFYLPHHAVIKESSETTKLRVVFDGSCKPLDGLSINELQYVGPTIQEDLFSIISRFRTYQYVITGDIKQMYRQVWVHPDHRKYQMILWRENINEPITSYTLNTVTFGTAAAPFLAIRSIFEVANINEDAYPVESHILKHDFYVDDLLTGANNITELKRIKHNLTHILNQSGFLLTKWKSNHIDLNESNIPNTYTTISSTSKLLGISWNTNDDEFLFTLNHIKSYDKINKRTILSITAQLFDPIGLVSPIIVIAKIIIQKLWQLQLGWDEGVPIDIHNQWMIFKKELIHIKNLRIPRFILIKKAMIIELHGFSDASEKAYGACIYIKSTNDENKSAVKLLASKSRVAPLKQVTLPRLELMAAVLLCQLMHKFKKILNLNIMKELYWTDSTIVINWINSQPNRWTTFVANRVSQIQELTKPISWHHVKSEDNPADIISRGCFPLHLKDSTLWWNGPVWLQTSNEYLSDNNETMILESVPEMRKQRLIALVNQEITSFVERFSSLNKLTRTVAWCLRFKKNCLTLKTNRLTTENLELNEINNALLVLVKLTQMKHFPNEYDCLNKNKKVNAKSSLLSLSPFLDKDKVLRVGGRLENSNYSYNKRHPILLPKNDYITKLIFQQKHIQLLHAGPNLLLSAVREKFWPISGRNTAKQICRDCVKCFRFNPKCINPIMGNLPRDRVTLIFPFHTVGVDYAGPLLIRDKLGRGSKNQKCYISLFICFATKAIHLEPITSLSTNAFIAAFRRFVARRGKPAVVYSDNGTNFVGANREIKELYQLVKDNSNVITQECTNEGITWHFIPSHSPHFGGLWEAGIKSTKYHLKRVMAEASLTFEELYTVLTQIESILNSRPLTPLTPDPNDLQALTPAHFLIGRTYVSLPDPDVSNIKLNRLDRFQHIQQLQQHFWHRWSKEYISQLNERTKWKNEITNISNGSMVLLKEDDQPPANWCLGRIIKTFPGSDGVTRVVKVQCANGTLKRPVVKLCLLPISDNTKGLNDPK